MWSRFFGEKPGQDVLVILRLAIEGEEDIQAAAPENLNADEVDAVLDARLEEVALLLRTAQSEAAKWDMKEIQLWNPTRTALLAASKIAPSVKVVQREEESITSLRWHGEAPFEDVTWLGNEKFGWC